MVDLIARKDSAGYEALSMSRQALKALSGLEGLPGGVLSPLARMQAPAGPAEVGELITAWDALDGTWRWAVPALIDPRCTIALLVGDGNVNLVGQYLFPDAEACGPGFKVDVEEKSLSLTGPLQLGELAAGFYSHLMLEEVAEPEQFRMNLAREHFWTLIACLDAYRAAALGRRILRAGGAPRGVGLMEIVEAWADGTSMLNPGWAVSLFSLLAPDDVPRDLAKRLPRLLPEMARKGYLDEQKDTGSGQTYYGFGDNLAPLLWGLTTALDFGLVIKRLVQPQAMGFTLLGGWRTPGGIWLADLSDMVNSGVSLVLTGPRLTTDLIDDVLGDDTLAPPWEEFAMETPYMRDAVISSLRTMPESRETGTGVRETAQADRTTTSRRFCKRCGEPLDMDVRFCRKCGLEAGMAGVGRAGMSSCPGCGYRYQRGAKFCRECGREL